MKNNYIKFLSSGMFTTIQDLKRKGYKKYGIPESGPLDKKSAMYANFLVGNPLKNEVIETTFKGPKIKFYFNCYIGITGAESNITVNKRKIKINKTISIFKNDILDIGNIINGNRNYIAVNGQFDINPTFGSLSTYEKILIGGIKGKKCKKNDVIYINKSNKVPLQIINETLIKKYYKKNYTIRIIKGPEWNILTKKDKNNLLKNKYTISSQSDRMGIRLIGKEMKMKKLLDFESCHVFRGIVQCPKNGKPIILMNDCQTTGGYPRIAIIAKKDIDLLSQINPNKTISFKIITLEESENLISYSIRKEKKLLI